MATVAPILRIRASECNGTSNKTAPPVACRTGPFWGASTPKVFVGKDLRQHNRSRGFGAHEAVDRVMQIPSVPLRPTHCFFASWRTP